jgi:type I restriction enzyme S subunit
MNDKYISSTAKTLSDRGVLSNRIPISPAGSLLFSFKLSIGQVAIVETEMYTNEAIATFRGSARLAISYAYYMLPIAAIQNANENIYGAKLLNAALIRSARLPLPPLEEQRQIAEYLDRETGQIDELIVKQEQLVATLTERRQAVITQAVTRGLDPEIKLVDSGDRWIGSIPIGWKTATLRHSWAVLDCKHVTAETGETGIPLASIREVQSRYVDLSEAKRTTAEFFEILTEGGREPRAGDLLFSRNATVGKVAQVPNHGERFAMGQDVCLLRSLNNAMSATFTQQLLQSPLLTNQMSQMMIGSTFKRLNVEQIRSFRLVVPPRPEQERIADHLESATGATDALVAKANAVVMLLRERRQPSSPLR